MEFFKKKEAVNPDAAQVSKEELEALGIKKGVSMTRGELDRHLEMLRRKSAYGENIGVPASSEEDSDQGQAAGQKREEMGK